MNIEENTNMKFSSLRGSSLKELLIYLENYYIEYRDNLNLPDDLTFGIEIEYELDETDERIKNDASACQYGLVINKNYYWKFERDESLSLGGGEIISPVLKDKKETWKDIREICDYLNQNKVDTLHNSGAHIHYGAMIFNDDYKKWITFLKLYVIYEELLCKFSHGDKTVFRENIIDYAAPVGYYIQYLFKYNRISDLNSLYETFNVWQKHRTFNFAGHINLCTNKTTSSDTLEFRSPNGTTDPTIWQNNINAFAKLILAVINDKIDQDYLDFKFNNLATLPSSHNYLSEEIDLKNVLEFVDIIFDNNLDKLNFLRQYLGDYKGLYERKNISYVKKFTK